MKNLPSFRTLVLAGAASLGLALAAIASDDPVPQPVDAGNRGLLGETYTHLGYSYVDVNHSGVDAHSFDFSMNQAVYRGFDTMLEYNYTQSEPFLDGHAHWQSLLAGARGYTPVNDRFKGFIEGGLGWAWAKAPMVGSDNSWAWFAGVGVEAVVARDVTVTPFIRFTDAPGIDEADEWNFGVKGNYWINPKFAVSALVSLDDDQQLSFGAGVNYHF